MDSCLDTALLPLMRCFGHLISRSSTIVIHLLDPSPLSLSHIFTFPLNCVVTHHLVVSCHNSIDNTRSSSFSPIFLQPIFNNLFNSYSSCHLILAILSCPHSSYPFILIINICLNILQFALVLIFTKCLYLFVVNNDISHLLSISFCHITIREKKIVNIMTSRVTR